MMNKKNTKASNQSVSQDEKGFEVKGPCGRAWFVPLSKVHEDYAAFLVQADDISKAEALEKAGESEDFLHTWFCEQYDWNDVQTDGTLIKEADPEQVKNALDFYLRYVGGGPTNDYELRGLPAD